MLPNRDVHVAPLAAAAPESAEAGAVAPRLAQWRHLLAATLSSSAPAHWPRVGLYDGPHTAEAVICHCRDWVIKALDFFPSVGSQWLWEKPAAAGEQPCGEAHVEPAAKPGSWERLLPSQMTAAQPTVSPETLSPQPPAQLLLDS